MSSKLDKMCGIARVAIRRYQWKGFTLQPGCAYGRDKDGALFASFAVTGYKFGLAEHKPQHIVVFRCVNENKGSTVTNHSSLWGAHSKIIGRCPLIREAGKYASPWEYVWQWTQIPYSSDLAQEIFAKLRAYDREVTKGKIYMEERHRS